MGGTRAGEHGRPGSGASHLTRLFTSLRCILVVLTLAAATATAGYGRQSSDEPAVPVEHRYKFLPAALYSPVGGFGVGVGVEIDHLILPGSRLLVTAEPAQHTGTYQANFATAEPVTARGAYGVARLFYRTTGRRFFYGLGPFSSRASRVAFEMETMEAELRAGYVFGGFVHVQPAVQLERHVVHGYEADGGDPASTFDAASRQQLALLTNDPDAAFDEHAQVGLNVGFVAGIDTRDHPGRPTRGVLAQVSARHFTSLDDLDLRFNRYGARAFVFVPFGRPGQTLGLQLIAQITDNQGEAPVPFYMLPLRRHDLTPGSNYHRFYGNDLLNVSIEVRRPLVELLTFVGVDGHLVASLGNVYDDLFDQFSGDVSFRKHLARAAHAPMGPALGAGVSLVSVANENIYLVGMLGVTPERLGLLTFDFVFDLRAIRPALGW